jgi:hypothetical protein
VHARPQTTVPQQSLVVLNAPLVVEAARHVAARLDREADAADTDAHHVARLWRIVLGRSPSADERATASAWLAAEAADESPPSLAVWQRLAHALLATAEFQFVD